MAMIVEFEPQSSRVGRLEDHLNHMLDDIVERALARGTIEPGHLPVVAGIATLLDVLEERIDSPAPPARTARIAVAGDDHDIRLVLQETESGAVASIKISADHALKTATRLLAAVGSRVRMG
jgi:hypothetical protein